MAKASYVWSGSEWVAVASALPQAHQRGVVYSAATSYTLGVNDTGKVILFSSNSPITVTVPNDSTYNFVIGQTIELVQMGSGTITVASAGDAVLRYRLGYTTFGQYSKIELMKIEPDEWLLSGDLD
jgi:hypothetical protein